MDISSKHYYWIDLLRFISAFLVMAAHYRGMFFVEYGLLPQTQHNLYVQIFYLLTRFGEESVVVFFILSGFLVGGNSIEKILNNKVDIKSYSIDRVVRILLPLAASTILVVIIDIIMNKSIPYIDIMGSFFATQGIITGCNYNVVLWSLSYEVWFYVLMGCIMVICRKNNTYILLPFLILAFCIYIFIRLNPLFLFIWFMGAFAFLLPRNNISYRKLKIVILIILLFASFVLSQTFSKSRSITINNLNGLNRNIAIIFIAIFTSFIIYSLITTIPKKKLSVAIDKLGSKLAKFSYSLYLTHYPLMGLMSYFGFPRSKNLCIKSISYYFVELMIGLIIAYLIYFISEKHTYKVKLLLKESVNYINNRQSLKIKK